MLIDDSTVLSCEIKMRFGILAERHQINRGFAIFRTVIKYADPPIVSQGLNTIIHLKPNPNRLITFYCQHSAESHRILE